MFPFRIGNATTTAATFDTLSQYGWLVGLVALVFLAAIVGIIVARRKMRGSGTTPPSRAAKPATRSAKTSASAGSSAQSSTTAVRSGEQSTVGSRGASKQDAIAGLKDAKAQAAEAAQKAQAAEAAQKAQAAEAAQKAPRGNAAAGAHAPDAQGQSAGRHAQTGAATRGQRPAGRRGSDQAAGSQRRTRRGTQDAAPEDGSAGE